MKKVDSPAKAPGFVNYDLPNSKDLHSSPKCDVSKVLRKKIPGNNDGELITALQKLVNSYHANESSDKFLKVSSDSQSSHKERTSEDHVKAVQNSIKNLERRRLHLLLRAWRATAHGLGMATSSQLRHLLLECRSSLVTSNDAGSLPPDDSNELLGESGCLNYDKMKKLSTNELLKAIEKIQTFHNYSALPKTVSDRRKYLLPSEKCSQYKLASFELKAASRICTSHDSDATESSSGGESCDENEVFEGRSSCRPLTRRAYYKYCRRRSWLASRWTWLNAMISDLDYRISQEQSSLLSSEKSKIPFHTLCKNVSCSDSEDCQFCADLGSCARTRPARWTQCRDYVRVLDVLKNTKRKKPSLCNCDLDNCILCKADNIRKSAVLSSDRYKDQLAFIDKGFHSVLSSKKEILQSEKFGRLLKSQQWEYLMRSIKLNPIPLKMKDPTAEKRLKLDKQAKSNSLAVSEASNIAARRSRGRGKILSDGEETETDIEYESDLNESNMDEDFVPPRLEESENSSLDGSAEMSESVPAHIERSSRRSSSSHHRLRQHFGNNYDIDNIVIPHNLVATSRVEKLEYKEIPTPKWRCSDICTAEDKIDVEEEEDASEEACLARHSRSEELERKMFLQRLKVQVSSNKSMFKARRTDSSGTNTPDHPLSPQLTESCMDTLSPIGSPPLTPLTLQEDSNQSNSQVSTPQGELCALSSSNGGSRVARSRSQLSQDDCFHDRQQLPEHVAPFETRSFPLSETEYKLMMLEANTQAQPYHFRSLAFSAKERDASSPATDATDSAPEDGDLEEQGPPQWVISGIKDASGHYVLDVKQN